MMADRPVFVFASSYHTAEVDMRHLGLRSSQWIYLHEQNLHRMRGTHAPRYFLAAGARLPEEARYVIASRQGMQVSEEEIRSMGQHRD